MQLTDRASQLEELHRETALAAHLALQPKAGIPSALTCQADACGVPISPARRRAVPGVQFCIQCQSRCEKRSRT